MKSRALGLMILVACSGEQPAPTETDQARPAHWTDESDFQPIANYPAGPYGRGLGAVIENHEFLGWRDPVASGYDLGKLETVRLGDFYDPNGTRTKLIVLNASAVWCTVCQAEMRDIQLAGIHQSYRQKGVELVGTLFEDRQGGPATLSDLVAWGSTPAHSITFPLLLDPGFKVSVYFTSDATPLNLIIDATTMRIVYAMMGYDNRTSTGLWAIVDRELDRRVANP
jgi:hypothetical protein